MIYDLLLYYLHFQDYLLHNHVIRFSNSFLMLLLLVGLYMTPELIKSWL